MRQYISKAIVDWMLRNEKTNKEEYEIYFFGVTEMLRNIINILTLLIIGVLMGEFLRTVVFIVAFKIIRSYAGGYHATTSLRCFVLTNIMLFGVLLLMKNISFSNTILICLAVIASSMILVLAPIDTENKRLDEIEYIFHRKRTIIAWSTEVIIAVLCCMIKYEVIAECIVFAQVILGLSLLCGQVKNIKERRKM